MLHIIRVHNGYMDIHIHIRQTYIEVLLGISNDDE